MAELDQEASLGSRLPGSRGRLRFLRPLVEIKGFQDQEDAFKVFPGSVQVGTRIKRALEVRARVLRMFKLLMSILASPG
ncbi:unnamed protein product [Umbelopsis vinacea]